MADKQQYVSIEDAAERLGVTRPSIHYYIRALGLTKYKFKLDKNAYISKEDFERVKQLKEEAAERSEPKEEALVQKKTNPPAQLFPK